MENDFLGTGWNFPVTLDTNYQVKMALDSEEGIRQSIWMILSTSPGERVMRPDFGCGIYDMVFSVNNVGTKSMIAEAVRQSLSIWEPRIDVLDVYSVPDSNNANLLLIEISYEVRSTNSRFNLVYPFYLE